MDENGDLNFKINQDQKTIEKVQNTQNFDEIEKQKKKEQIFQENYFNGDLPIFLDQISKYGNTLDFAYLYGKKDNKKFIGFHKLFKY